ncbi:MAG: hypothetical protein WA117_11700 [Verrucomicrobiia bacterium]
MPRINVTAAGVRASAHVELPDTGRTAAVARHVLPLRLDFGDGVEQVVGNLHGGDL